jgi:hypothetical protein
MHAPLSGHSCRARSSSRFRARIGPCAYECQVTRSTRAKDFLLRSRD